MKIIFLGAPGAGKGTQADIVSARLGISSILTEMLPYFMDLMVFFLIRLATVVLRRPNNGTIPSLAVKHRDGQTMLEVFLQTMASTILHVRHEGPNIFGTILIRHHSELFKVLRRGLKTDRSRHCTCSALLHGTTLPDMVYPFQTTNTINSCFCSIPIILAIL